jgi:magnesium transporter
MQPSLRPWRRLRRYPPPGTAPGTLIVDPDAARPVVRLMLYGRAATEERTVEDVDSLADLIGGPQSIWVDVQGLGDLATIERLGALFNLHHLALEDVLHPEHRPKVEEFDDYLFIIARVPCPGEPFHTEQLAIFAGRGWLISFQEGRRHQGSSGVSGGDCFALVRERIRHRRGRICEGGADYLAYALLDTTTDAYFPVLEDLGEKIEVLEQAVIAAAEASLIGRIYGMKRDLLNVRRAIWPQREVINALQRDDSGIVADATKVFLRDCYDHTVQLIDTVETYRDIAAGLIDVYLSSVNTRLNEVMKVLTIIATIFMPLSFITGLYGMNFDRTVSPWNLPELGWKYGYPMVLGLMLLIALGMLLQFRRKGWLGSGWPAARKAEEEAP